jgi:two-component system sensor histidine kinase ChvG
VRLRTRLLVFNLLLVFVPVGGLLLLGPYERQLLESQERAMVRQGRLAAAALAAGGAADAASARRLLVELDRRSESRLRVVDRDGNLLADSSVLGPKRPRTGAPPPAATPREKPLYALGALPFALWQRLSGPSGIEPADAAEYYATAKRLDGPELAAALAGRYGAATRLAPPPARGVILYSALPVRIGEEVAGAVLVSQSTVRILAQLYEVRLAMFEVFLFSVAAAVVLSLFLAGTVARPLRALAGEARALVDGRGRLRGRFRAARRRDEIGELSAALEELTRRLESRQAATEAFAADVSHELKNPLASIRGATELLAAADSAGDRRRFLAVVEQEVARMERLLAGVREIVGLEAQERGEERAEVDLAALAAQLVDAFRLRGVDGVSFAIHADRGPHRVAGAPEKYAALIENLLDNAASFAPPGSTIEIALERRDDSVRVVVADRGPGIPEEHLARVFDRFFTWRPAGGDRHSGLGLAIVKAVAEAHGGRVTAANRSEGGARFTIEVPAA